MTSLLFFGDIFGRSGRDAIGQHLPALKQKFAPDLIVANADNAAHGNGVTPKVVEELLSLGIDVLTGGDHFFDQKEILSSANKWPNMLRPTNFPSTVAGFGYGVFEAKNGKRVLVIHAVGRVFLEAMADNPFVAVQNILQKLQKGRDYDVAVLDFHAEATSEKVAMGLCFDGQISAVLGTHTHVPTADAYILPQGTAYITDVGMCGPTNSVIGADPRACINMFLHGVSFERRTPSQNAGQCCAVHVQFNSAGLAESITPIVLR
jgi:2',3'-cyclic-nucleotide 2'-phosphodiesterase